MMIILMGYHLSRSAHDNGVCMAGKQEGESRPTKAIEMMKPTDKDKADTGENRGLRVSCGSPHFICGYVGFSGR